MGIMSMTEPITEQNLFVPASKRWFVGSLSHSPYFKGLRSAEQDETFSLFCNQLVADASQQQKIIRANFIERPGLPQEIVEKGKAMSNEGKRLLSSPPFEEVDGSPLEDWIAQNWHSTSREILTIPNMIEDLIHLLRKRYQHAPALQDGSTHSYARYDATRNPFIQQHIEALRANISHSLPESGIDNTKLLLAKTGSSILPAILHTLQFNGRRQLDPRASENFILSILSDGPYFEAENAMGAMRPAGAFVSSRLSFSPPGSQGLSGPMVHTLSTESRARHLQSVDRSLYDAGICCFYAEPIGNNPAMDVPHLRKVIDTIKAARKIDSKYRKIFLIIDTSIMGGKFELSKFFSPGDFENINVVVLESANKYLSYGANKGDFGIVYGVGPDTGWLFDSLKSTFQMNGVPDLHDVLSAPLPDDEIIVERKKRLNDNTHFLAGNINKLFETKLSVSYPGLEHHPQYKRAKDEYDFQGSIFFLTLPSEEAYAKVEVLLAKSEIIGYGSSYGFNQTRAEVIRRKEENSNEKKAIGLRVSVGTENIRKLILVLEEFKTILDQV